ALQSLDFKNALEQFQKLVEKMIIQKTKEASGLYTEEDDVIDYDKFCKTTRALFGSAVKDHNIQAFFRKTINNLDMPDWLEILKKKKEKNDGLLSQSKESMVKKKKKKKQITDSGDILLVSKKKKNKKNVLHTFLENPSLRSQKKKKKKTWITGCDFLPQLKKKKKEKKSTNNGYVIKPMKNCLLCVCMVTTSDHLPKDSILMGDDKGYVYLKKKKKKNFIMKQYKAENDSKKKKIKKENFNILKRKLHDDWVGKVKYISALKCFGSCSSDSLRSFVLDDIKRLEDNL
ncbi:WDR64 protein, partial [Mionectes macconnelli]|nr:WDR64 protein [Mionectes macconnelli]